MSRAPILDVFVSLQAKKAISIVTWAVGRWLLIKQSVAELWTYQEDVGVIFDIAL